MKDNTSKIRTVCRKCKNIVNAIQWTGLTTEYICAKCGYSTTDSDKVERIKIKEEIK